MTTLLRQFAGTVRMPFQTCESAAEDLPGPRHGFHKPLRRPLLFQLPKGIIHRGIHLGLVSLRG